MQQRQESLEMGKELLNSSLSTGTYLRGSRFQQHLPHRRKAEKIYISEYTKIFLDSFWL